MAIYEFQCNCGVVTEHICPMSQRPDSVPCSRCGGKTVQKVSAVGILTSGMSHAPIDVVIGRDAAKRWDRIHERQEARDKVRSESGKTALTATGRNEYEATDKKLQFVSTPEPGGE